MSDDILDPVEYWMNRYDAEKARADAAEHWKATYYAEIITARGDLAAALADIAELRSALRDTMLTPLHR